MNPTSRPSTMFSGIPILLANVALSVVNISTIGSNPNRMASIPVIFAPLQFATFTGAFMLKILSKKMEVIGKERTIKMCAMNNYF